VIEWFKSKYAVYEQLLALIELKRTKVTLLIGFNSVCIATQSGFGNPGWATMSCLLINS